MTEEEKGYGEALAALASAHGFGLAAERVPAVAALLPGLEGRLFREAASLPQEAPMAVAFDPDPEGKFR